MNNVYHREEDLTEDILTWEEKYDFEISDLITSARLHKGWTQAELAERIGTQQPSIARAENGASLASHGLLKKIAYALGTELLPPRFSFMDREEAINTVMTTPSQQQAEYVFHSWGAFAVPHESDYQIFNAHITEEFTIPRITMNLTTNQAVKNLTLTE